MKWFIPSWNGDFRLEPSTDDKDKTSVRVFKPTVAESRIIGDLGAKAVEEGWLEKAVLDVALDRKIGDGWEDIFTLAAPLEKVGPVMAKIVRPGPAVLTAMAFKDGKIETCSEGVAELQAMAETATERGAKDPKKAATAAVTAKRPTPSCPQCTPGAIKPASEVLLAFLTPEQHKSWAKDRTLIVEGELSGHRYRLAHRHSVTAQRQGRVCWDLDLDCVVHFHDTSVPPEEEILAAKLILEHREPWLRNEATMFHRVGCAGAMIFKNPFGDGLDGVADATFTQQIGAAFMGMHAVVKGMERS